MAATAAAVAKARALVEHELRLIAELGYEPYFLTVYDIVRFARSQGILCQGRGSAANSAVCYCLGITEVDPARMEMLFERFISKERNEPPDIDVDFEHERREEVIQYIYGKYGRDRAALAATVISYRPKSALRDVGKALGLDLAQVDRLAKSLAWWDGRRVRPERLREVGFDPDNRIIQRLIALVNIIVGFPRHLSQHVGGFVISRGPLSRLVPIENAAMTERTVIQWDKDDLDAIGLLKVDVLALGMLTAIRRALDLVSGCRGKPFALSDVPAEDPGVYEMMGRADTIGVFQIESRAQQAMLPRMRPNCFYDIVVEVAIVRPGPIQGGMVHPYLRRRQGIEPVVLSLGSSEEGARAHAGCAHLPGTSHAACHRCGRLHARRSRPTPARHGRLEKKRRPGAVREAAQGRHVRTRLLRPSSPTRSIARYSASANTAFPSRTRPASHCWCTHRAGSNAMSRLLSPARCSTASLWVSTRRRSWCRMRSTTASRCGQ